eukprot:1139729-Pyramimonas_sp.AAC.2
MGMRPRTNTSLRNPRNQTRFRWCGIFGTASTMTQSWVKYGRATRSSRSARPRKGSRFPESSRSAMLGVFSKAYIKRQPRWPSSIAHKTRSSKHLARGSATPKR